MERRHAAGALLALAACILCTAAAPTASNHTALDLYDGEPEGCYYNFQHYGEGDRIMTNEPCLNCTCHNRMLMCYLRVCPFTKPIGQDCTVEKRADQCCPIVTCPDVPVDLLTLTSTTSPAEYGATGVGKYDKYGCSINGKYFPEGSKVPPTPNKPCEHCYCIRNMTTCVMQECTLHVDGCTPIYHKDVCCPVRYSCDHAEDEILLLDDKTTTVRPTPGFLLTTTTSSPVTQFTQDCVHDDQIFADGALIKTEKACEHCYCMKGDIVCVVQECGTPMENEGKNCTSLPPREGQCCPDTYICEGDELNTEYPSDLTTNIVTEDLTTLSPPRRVGVEGSGYRKEPDNIALEEPHPTEPAHEGSGDDHELEHTVHVNDVFTTEDNTKYTYTTISLIEDVNKEDVTDATSVKPSDETQSSTVTHLLDDHEKPSTVADIEQKFTSAETVELDSTESSTSSIPSYDHKLETSQPDVFAVTENEILVHDDKITLTTIAPILEEKEVTTFKPHEENIVTDAISIQQDKYITTTTIGSILEDEGITTESDREQQTILTGDIEEHSYEPGLHITSTTSAPFLEEVEGIPTGTYGQNVVTDRITESDIQDVSKDKSDAVTTPAAEIIDNLMDVHKHIDVESTKIPELESHEIALSTTSVPTLEEVEKTFTTSSIDLITSKSEETHEEDKIISTSTHQPISMENEEAVTENLEQSPVSTKVPELLDTQKLDFETEKSQTEKYDHVADEKMYEDHADISTTASAPFIDQKIEETIKTSEEPVTIASATAGDEITDTEKYISIPTSAPIYDDDSSTVENKDTNIPQVQDSDGLTKPEYIEKDNERATTHETSYDVSTEKMFDQKTDKTQKPSPTSTPITDEMEMATTEFIRDQDFVTTAPLEQDSLKPGEYVPSTSSTPFLEEIEKLTTEISHGHVVTDIITEKEDLKPSKQVTSATETSLPSEPADITTAEPDKGLNTIPSGIAEAEESSETPVHEKTTQASSLAEKDEYYPQEETTDTKVHHADVATTMASSLSDDSIVKEDKVVATTEPSSRKEDEHHVEIESTEKPELITEIFHDSSPTTESFEKQETKSPPTLSEQTHDIHENVPPQELTTETSKVEEVAAEIETKPDVQEVITMTTQTTPILPEITTINLGENEIDEDKVSPPGRIPGEGDCLLNGITYRNESSVPSTNKCHSDCRCMSSIIKCSPIICSSPPEYMDNCQPTYDSPDSCCPTYVCDQFRETLPPMPHIQITTELPSHPSSIECHGDQCEIDEDKVQPAVPSEICTNKDCGGEIDKKTDIISSCGPHGCTEPSSTPECADGKCISTSEECTDGECKYTPITDSSKEKCEGENCESSVVNVPHAPECENGGCKDDHTPEITPVTVPCTEEGGCKATDLNVVQDCVDETCRRKETLDIQAKPSCIGHDCEQQLPVQAVTETSTLDEIITKLPEIHVSDTVTTDASVDQTTAPEKQDSATETNVYDTKIPVETTQQTIQTSQFESDKEPLSHVTQEESKLPGSISTDKESATEAHTKSPILDSENDIQPTKIPEEYITESQQLEIDTLTEKQPTFETSKYDDIGYTEPSQYITHAEEQTIRVITDEDIPIKQPTTVESNDKLTTTSEPKFSESETHTAEPDYGVSEVTEAQVIESHGASMLPEIHIVENEERTQEPLYTNTFEDVTKQPIVETAYDTTEYQSAPEYQSKPMATTLIPTELYTTLKESEEKIVEPEIIDDDKKHTQSHVSVTELQAVSLESSTQENTEAYSPHITIASEEHALPTESTVTPIKHDMKDEDKVTEENLAPSGTDKIQELEKEHVMGTKAPGTYITETADFTSEPYTKEHEIYTENELHISLPDKESTTEVQKETDFDFTPPSIFTLHETTENIVSEVIESSSPIPDKVEEDLAHTAGHDINTEGPEFVATISLDHVTEKPHEIEQELTQPEKPETETQDTELETEISMEHVTMPEKATRLPEILSHKKEHSSESPIVSESEDITEKPIRVEEIDIQKPEQPSTDKTLITDELEAQTEKPGDVTEELQQPIINDEIPGTDITIEKTEKPVVVPPEIATEDIYIKDVEKSTEYEEKSTERPETHETELNIPVKTEPTTVFTPIEKETATDLPDVIPVTDKYDVNIKKDEEEVSTDKTVLEYTSPQSYVPDTQESEISKTEKTQTLSLDSTTKTIETFTTEQAPVFIDTTTLAAPGIDKFVTEKVPDIKEMETPEIQETTEVSVVDLTKNDELTTISPEQNNIDEDLDTKIHDSGTQQQGFVTDIPEFSRSPEEIPETLVTESIDINKVSDEAQVTDSQILVTEHSLVTELPEEEESVKPIKSESSTDEPKVPVEISTSQDEHIVSPDLQSTTVGTLGTDHEEVTLPSAMPHKTDAVDITESLHKVTTLPESSSIKTEEISTTLPSDDHSEHEVTQTISSEVLTEGPAEASSQIPDSEKVELEDSVTKTPEPIAGVDIITHFDESHTVPQETATETVDIKASTESIVEIASESHGKDELTEPTSAPVYELPETTPYLIELQEHTHKVIQEVTTSSQTEEELTTEKTISGDIEHEHHVPDITTETIMDKQTEVQEPTRYYEQTSTPSEVYEKTTQPPISKEEESLPTTQSAEIDIKETIYSDKELTTSVPTKISEIEKESPPESIVTDSIENILTTSEKTLQSDLAVEITTPEEISVQSTEKSTSAIPEELPTQAPVAVDKITKPEEKPSDVPKPLPDLSKPGPSDIQPTDEVPSPDEDSHFPPSGTSGYGNEPDYVEEDQAFGPGTCRYGGKVYVSAQQIPRDDPCDFCFCFRSDIICLQQSCPPPIHGCHEEPIQGFCCPRYECPVSMATTLNITTTTTTTTTTLPPHFPTHSYKGAAQRRGCQIKGHTYKVGEVVRGSSGPCLHCTCGGDGQMKCDPKACTPEPMLRQMIAAAVSAKRRR